MPAMPMSEVVVLGLILAAFAAFGITLFSVSLYVTLGKPGPDPSVAREVTPARRVGAH